MTIIDNPDKDLYEGTLRDFEAAREKAIKGRIVVRDRDCEWLDTRQGRVKYYLHDTLVQDTAIGGWRVFAQEIDKMSGRHRHQGSTVIYVRRGYGHTIVNGRKQEWKAGDVIMLPIMPGGVDHQHFRGEGSEPCEWIALVFGPFHTALGSMFGQIENNHRWMKD